MTWLNEIEYIYLLTEKPPKRGGRKAMAKMVRVIREQGRALALTKKVVDGEFTTEFIGLWQQILAILSDDAKELLG